MKQYKKPTRTQKEVLTAHGHKSSEWRFVAENDGYFEFVNPTTRQRVSLDSSKRKR